MPPKLATLGSLARTRFAAALLFAFALVLLAEPIVRFATHTYTSADFAQDYALTKVPDATSGAGNRGVYDPAGEMQPWLLFNREELAAGRLPLWNPYNGNGAPHHANYQSAVFSPFSLPFYVLSFKSALLVAALMRLVLLGLFTFLFLRALEFEFLSALLSATAFMLSGKSVMLLGYPHSAVAVALPAALWCSERAAQAITARAPGRETVAWFAGLCAAFTLGIYAGHPEPLVFVGMLAFAWTAWRALALGVRFGWKFGARLLAGFGTASAIALLLGAPQILPFAEYLGLSASFGTREAIVQPSLVDWWPLLVYPSAVGSTVTGLTISYRLPTPNFEQVNTSYPGGAVLVLAAFGLVCLRHDRRVRLFALGIVAWLLMTCDVGGLGRAWDHIPWIGSMVLLSRSQAVWLFGLAVLAGVALDRLLVERPTSRTPVVVVAVVLVGGGILAACTWKARILLDQHIGSMSSTFSDSVRSKIEHERFALGLSTAAAVTVVAVSLLLRGRAAKHACAALLIAIVVFQNGWMQGDYNPTADDRLVFPRTQAIETLQREVGDAPLLVLTDNGVPPDTNMMYGLRIPQNYDALGVRRFEALQQWTLDPYGGFRTPRKAQPEHLALFGIEYVVTPGDWVPIGTAHWDRRGPDQPRKQSLFLRTGMLVEQSFVSDCAGLDAVTVFAGTLRNGNAGSGELTLRLFDDADALVAQRNWTAAELREGLVVERDISFAWSAFEPMRAFLGRYATLTFEPLARSRGRTFRLVAEARCTSPDDAVIFWQSPGRPRIDERLTVDGVERDAVLDFDYRSRSDSFENVAQLGGMTLQRFTPGLGPFFAVDTGIQCVRPAEAKTAVLAPDFNPYRLVTLEAADPMSLVRRGATDGSERTSVDSPVLTGAPGAREPPTSAEIVARTPTEIRLRVVRRKKGYLVACQTWFPGWRAFVNGAERPVWIANYTFQGVELDPGANEVVLRYEPGSLRLGAWLALFGALLGATLWLASSRAPSTRPRST